MKYHKIIAVISFFIMFLFICVNSTAQDVSKITKEELRAMLENIDLVIIDIRREGHWTSSESKIKGAVREESGKAESWADKYKKDKTYVLYCA